MIPFFQAGTPELVDSPNGFVWWHSMPLPDGRRISGYHQDKDAQFKTWRALRIPNDGGLAGKRVLDIGANDGFYSLAALMAGAEGVTAINSADWETYPLNIRYASESWGLRPELVTGDFRTHAFGHRYDVIFFLGVLYHLEDVFGCMRLLRELLLDEGTVYLETQMTCIRSDLPIFEYASDVYRTTASQDKSHLHKVGISNYLFPNEHAIRNLAHSYDFHYESLGRPDSMFSPEHGSRGLFKLVKHEGAAA
jgi:2-polyprenyl-3-methyl-5-hydroxy-6-metoxy-1,4-benzoquinol methylase